MFEQRGELAARGLDRAALAALMEREDLTAAIVTSPENVYYLTGYPTLPTSGNPILYALRNIFPFSVIVERDGTRHLLAWGFSLEDVDVDVEHVVAFNDRRGALEAAAEVISKVLGSRQGRLAQRVGVEPFAPYEFVQHLQERVGHEGIVPAVDQVLLALRRRKSEAELVLLKRSLEIAEGAVQRVLAQLKIGTSRLEAIRWAKQAVLELGGDGVSHVTMSFGHANPEIAIDERLREGDLVVVDIGAKLDGYTSDCRRYGFAGEMPATLTGLHASMVGIVADVAAQMVPGTTYAELTRAAVQGFEKAGLPLLGRFTHVGHGIGIETEEEWIDDDEGRVIDEGMVVAIELYTDAAPYGQIGDEETYIIGASGPERISLLETAVRRL